MYIIYTLYIYSRILRDKEKPSKTSMNNTCDGFVRVTFKTGFNIFSL